MFEISTFTKDEADQWHDLWRGYQADENLSEDVIVEQVSYNWPRVLQDKTCFTHALRLKETGEAVGFTNFVTTWCRTHPQDEIYLCDLFVMPAYQGKGGGRMLINSVLDYARDHNLNRVAWLTQSHNQQAQKLYDKLADGEEWIRYKIKA